MEINCAITGYPDVWLDLFPCGCSWSRQENLMSATWKGEEGRQSRCGTKTNDSTSTYQDSKKSCLIYTYMASKLQATGTKDLLVLIYI